MPANLTQQYRKAEDAYRRAVTPEERLQGLQAMLRELPKHKGTDKLQADLKQKISKARKGVSGPTKAGRKGHSVRIPRQGAGTVTLLGGPNAGKSQLLKTLTHATPEVAPYPFTTHQPLPGMMPWQDIMVQLIDTPPITQDFLEPYMHGLVRGADLVLLMVDLGSDEGIEQYLEVVDKLNSTKTRLARKTYLDEDDIGLSFTASYLVPNKIDLPGADARLEMLRGVCTLDLPEYVISAVESTNVEPLRASIYELLDVVRVYCKLPHQKEADFDRPFTVPRGGTLMDVAEQIHKDFVTNFSYARVWGRQIHNGTKVKGDYVVEDKDVVEIHH